MRLFPRDITPSAMRVRQATLVQEARGTAQNIVTERQLNNYLWCQTQVMNNNINRLFMALHLVRPRSGHTHTHMAPHLGRPRSGHTHTHTHTHYKYAWLTSWQIRSGEKHILYPSTSSSNGHNGQYLQQCAGYASRQHFNDDHYCVRIAANAIISVCELLLIM